MLESASARMNATSEDVVYPRGGIVSILLYAVMAAEVGSDLALAQSRMSISEDQDTCLYTLKASVKLYMFLQVPSRPEP